MLVLGRKEGDEVIINDDIRVVVMSVRGSQVRLGLAAPPDVRIRRAEIVERESTPEEPALTS